MISLALAAAFALDAASFAQTSAALNALGAHPFESPRNRAAAQFVGAKLQEAGLAQTTVEDFVFAGSSGTNVVATLAGRSDRLMIVATHHDTRPEVTDVSDRSRSLALLIEVGRQARKTQMNKTWILASFDGGESRGEGFAHYLENLGKSRDLIDGMLLLDVGAADGRDSTPTLIAPACPGGVSGRAIASLGLVSAAVSSLPPSLEAAFDDPGISLLTQPFIRAFKTECDPTALRALEAGIGVILASDTPYSRRFSFEDRAAAATDGAQAGRKATRLGEVAFGALQGLDGSSRRVPDSDSWLVVGRSVWPGWLVFTLGILTLLPGLLALRAQRTPLLVRAVYSALLTAIFYLEPEVGLFAAALPSLVPPSAPRKFLIPAFVPFALLLSAGGLGFLRGQVTGSFLSIWAALGLPVAFGLLFLAPARARKGSTRAKKARR